MTSPLVCVTGASGYVGSHIVRALLEHGYRVRAAVRDASDPVRVDHLRAMGELEFQSADLTHPRGFDLSGCDLVVHAASPARFTARDPQRDIVDVALAATRTVLEAAARSGTVRRVVQTSSLAAVVDAERPSDHLFTEEDWNESSTVERAPYFLSKTMAEREARSLSEKHGTYELVAINPSFVMGPVMTRQHLRSSPAFVHGLIARKVPGCLNMSLALVDVRDVAEAHVRALTIENPSQRYICNAGTLWMVDLARILSRRYPGRRVPTRRLPDLLAYAAVPFNKQLTFHFLRANLGHFRRASSERIRRELGMEFRPLEETIADTASSIIEGGWA